MKEAYAAFVAGGVFRESQPGTKDESWKESVKRGLNTVKENERPGNRGMKLADFEKQFDAALKAVEDERDSH